MDATPTWDWSNMDGSPASRASSPDDGPGMQREGSQSTAHSGAPKQTKPEPAKRPRRYGPRTCRICLETVEPTFPETVASSFGLPASSSKPMYVSEDPELGRLLSPCKCKGSQKYVHEGCLNSWRLANPTAARNYWQCPTCKFTYRMARLHWAAVLSSGLTKAVLTISILILSIFILGFVADPILDLWFDPVGTISDTVTSVIINVEDREVPPPAEQTTWAEHFLKGFFSFGLVGFFKTLFFMSPVQYLWNLRGNGLMLGGRRAGTGRGRVESINLGLVLIGVATFLMSVWKAVHVVSARVLKNVSDNVIDIGEDDDDADMEEDDVSGDRKDQ